MCKLVMISHVFNPVCPFESLERLAECHTLLFPQSLHEAITLANSFFADGAYEHRFLENYPEGFKERFLSRYVPQLVELSQSVSADQGQQLMQLIANVARVAQMSLTQEASSKSVYLLTSDNCEGWIRAEYVTDSLMTKWQRGALVLTQQDLTPTVCIALSRIDTYEIRGEQRHYYLTEQMLTELLTFANTFEIQSLRDKVYDVIQHASMDLSLFPDAETLQTALTSRPKKAGLQITLDLSVEEQLRNERGEKQAHQKPLNRFVERCSLLPLKEQNAFFAWIRCVVSRKAFSSVCVSKEGLAEKTLSTLTGCLVRHKDSKKIKAIFAAYFKTPEELKALKASLEG